MFLPHPVWQAPAADKEACRIESFAFVVLEFDTLHSTP